MSVVEIKVPDIGDYKDVDVIEVMVKAGDAVTVDQALITLETDKATMDVPSDVAGKIVEVKKGATTAHVKIDIGGGQVVTSAITNESVEELGLAGAGHLEGHAQLQVVLQIATDARQVVAHLHPHPGSWGGGHPHFRMVASCYCQLLQLPRRHLPCHPPAKCVERFWFPRTYRGVLAFRPKWAGLG